jgi:hypothetical protein
MADNRISISFTNADCNQAVVSTTEPVFPAPVSRSYFIIIANQETGTRIAYSQPNINSLTFSIPAGVRIISAYVTNVESTPVIDDAIADARLANILSGGVWAASTPFRYFLVSCKYQKSLVDKNTEDAIEIQNEGCDKFHYAYLKGIYIAANYLVSGDMPSKATPLLDLLDVELNKCDCEDCGCS